MDAANLAPPIEPPTPAAPPGEPMAATTPAVALSPFGPENKPPHAGSSDTIEDKTGHDALGNQEDANSQQPRQQQQKPPRRRRLAHRRQYTKSRRLASSYLRSQFVRYDSNEKDDFLPLGQGPTSRITVRSTARGHDQIVRTWRVATPSATFFDKRQEVFNPCAVPAGPLARPIAGHRVSPVMNGRRTTHLPSSNCCNQVKRSNRM